MQRVAIIGCSGSGKSSLARELGEMTGLPVTHLDALFWQPGWVEPDEDAFHNEVRRIARGNHWIIDGNYSQSMPERLDRADTVILLDVSRWMSMWRITKRVIDHYGRTRPDLAEGCEERFDPDFFWWVWRWHARHRSRFYKTIAERGGKQRILVLRSPAAVSLYLKSISESRPATT